MRRMSPRWAAAFRSRRTALWAMATALFGVNASSSCSSKSPSDESHYAARRREMVERQLKGRDVTDPRVLDVMGRVPRHRFVPRGLRGLAYSDGPLPIGGGQTISQPYIVALMTQLAAPKPSDRVLDVGTGSGYQAAVIAELTREVFSIEIRPELAEQARTRLIELGFRNVTVRSGDGYRGWPEHAPFQIILVAAAPGDVPQPLLNQLAPGGRLVIPVGDDLEQNLLLITKRDDGSLERRTVAPVRFVPMTGEALEPER